MEIKQGLFVCEYYIVFFLQAKTCSKVLNNEANLEFCCTEFYGFERDNVSHS